MKYWWYFDRWVYVPSTWGTGSNWMRDVAEGPELLDDMTARMIASKLSAAGPIGNYTRVFRWSGGQWMVDNDKTLPGQATRYA